MKYSLTDQGFKLLKGVCSGLDNQDVTIINQTPNSVVCRLSSGHTVNFIYGGIAFYLKENI
jgi:hypothetical protein